MQKGFSARRLLLAGASVLAIMTSVSEAGATLFNIPGFYSYTAPTSGVYDITAAGGQGGNANFNEQTASYTYFGGGGAIVGGDVSLTAGEQLGIYVGGQGQSGHFGSGYGGGGGGLSLVKFPVSADLIAGGGGGAGYKTNGGPGSPGLAGNGFGSYGGAGGDGGSGGYGGSYRGGGNGGGGTGYFTAGQNGQAGGSPSGQGGDFGNGGGYQAAGGVEGGGGSGFNGGGGGGAQAAAAAAMAACMLGAVAAAARIFRINSATRLLSPAPRTATALST